MCKKSIRLFSILLISCMLVISFVGCSNKNNENIMIGVMVPTSGSEAYYGNDMLQSYQLACDEINASGGVLGRKLELYVADDGCDPNMATLAASKIIAKNVDFVVGGYGSSATIPTLQQYYDANLIMLISCANSTEITKLGFNQSFMLNSPMSYEAVTFTDLCKSLDVKNVALIHQGDTATKTLSDYCEKILPENGIKIATVQVTEKNTPDVSAVVTSIRSSNADLVYWCGYHADGSNVIKQLRRGGYTGKIAVGDGSASTELITACGTDGEGVYITSPPFVKFSEGGEKFVDDYRAKFNAEPGTYATLSYDTIYVLKTAIEEAGSTDFASVRDAVQNIEYKGLSGLIKFNQNREREVSNFIILQIKNGEFQLITL